jgi:Tfp pilus assembly protein PilE
MKNSRGFTLLELILAMSLTMIVLVAVGSVMVFGMNVHRNTMVELDVQANIRKVSAKINETTRYATSTHAVPMSSFHAGVRDADWSYLGVTASGEVVLDVPGSTPSSPRNVQVIAPAQDGVTYRIVFERVEESPGVESNSMVGIRIVGYRDGTEVVTIETGLEVLNSNQIDHHSSDTDPAVALAFSTETVGSAKFTTVTPDAYITLVLDMSGSMEWRMAGQYSSIGDRRYVILKNSAEKLISDFSKMGFDVYVSVVVFGSNANEVWDFRNVNKSNSMNAYDNLIADIRGLSPYENSLASTNTGDGIRKGYYLLKNKSDDLVASGKSLSDFTRHMMILVDGGTEAYSYFSSGSNSYFYTGSKSTGQTDYIPGYGNRTIYYDYDSKDWWGNLTTHYGDAYVDRIGDNLVKPYQLNGDQAIQSFVIGFSADSDDHISLNSIGEATVAKEFVQADGSTKRFVIATNSSDLDMAFGSFTEEVATSLWSIYGPRLK